MPELTHCPAPPPAPDRPLDAHKGTFGTVIVIGGSPTMLGAPAMTASAALRSGAGLVKLAMPARLLPWGILLEPGATGLLRAADPAAAGKVIAKADPDNQAVLAIGPGLEKAAGPLVLKLLAGPRAMVLDADGLNLLAAASTAKRPRPKGKGPLVLTPHPGEFRRLAQPLGIQPSPTDPATRPAAAAALAQAHDAVVVLKGRQSIVCDGQRIYVNPTGGPALATAGSGDVLTGLIAALIAQAMAPFEAAVLGVYLHGLAADLWTATRGPSGLTARDLANLLPDAFELHRGENRDQADQA